MNKRIDLFVNIQQSFGSRLTLRPNHPSVPPVKLVLSSALKNEESRQEFFYKFFASVRKCTSTKYEIKKKLIYFLGIRNFFLRAFTSQITDVLKAFGFKRLSVSLLLRRFSEGELSFTAFNSCSTMPAYPPISNPRFKNRLNTYIALNTLVRCSARPSPINC